jgi:hypothetical protein
MAAQAALTVLTRGTVNGAPTANVTYNPIMASFAMPDGRLLTRWQEQTAAYAVGYSDLALISKPAMGNQPTQTVSLRMTLPTLDVTAPATGTGIQPAPSVAYFQDFKLEAKFPTRGTQAERWEALARFLSIAGQGFLLNLVKANEQVT